VPAYHAPAGTNKLLVVVALLLAVAGSARAAGVGEVVGLCARCHENPAALEVNAGGHSSLLDCQSCHPQKKPHRFGRQHRGVPRCTSCHAEIPGHPQKQRSRRQTNKNCMRCHAPHGSPNLSLVGTGIRQPHRLAPMSFVSEAGAAPGGFTNPDAPGTGLCEVCHRKTEFYRRSGAGAPHFSERCTLCHQHAVAFEPVADAGNCRICHTTEAALFELPSPHSARFDCVTCHADTGQPIGPGHETIRDCQSCHETPPSHAPNGRALPCASCHDPHGSTNLSLIAETIETPAGARPIVFTNLMGRADGGFASASAPGSGLCEACHTDTRVYDAAGTGAPHFTERCTLCHLHDTTFEPVASEQNCQLCHVEQAERFTLPSPHSARFECVSCHADTGQPIGPGHESVPACQTCHETPATHAPDGRPLDCARCHDPHGSTNMSLVAEAIETPQGALRPIRFDNLMGRADGSFASATDPGAGICEVCHTTTRYYTADGSGEAHYTVSCLPCHRHSEGFAPR